MKRLERIREYRIHHHHHHHHGYTSVNSMSSSSIHSLHTIFTVLIILTSLHFVPTKRQIRVKYVLKYPINYQIKPYLVVLVNLSSSASSCDLFVPLIASVLSCLDHCFPPPFLHHIRNIIFYNVQRDKSFEILSSK